MLYGKEPKKIQEEVDYEIYVDEICNRLAREMEDEYGLVCIGTGGCMLHDVEEISIRFYRARTILSIDEARELQLVAMKRMVELVNQHEKIRPFLREYPFPLTRADIELSFDRINDQNFKNVDFLFFAKGSLFYCKYNSSTDKVEKIFIESLNEALKIFENSPRKFLPKGKRSM